MSDRSSGCSSIQIHVIDKQTPEIVRALDPAPGKTVAHVEYDRHGRHAPAPVWEYDGAVIVACRRIVAISA